MSTEYKNDIYTDHGISRGYRKNGNIWWELGWIKGKPSGIDREWNIFGNLAYSAYQNRQWEGERIDYYYENDY